jgi:molecular chaperone HtpG
MLRGVIDSPDIPLNVSRSYLQADGAVKKISSYISRKVADKLASLFKKDREDFQQKWNDIKLVIEYGMLTDDKFFEKAEKFALYPTVDGNYFTFEELQDKIKDAQTDKDGQLVVLYASDKEGQHSYIEAAKAKGYEVLLMDSPIVPHLLQKLETSKEKLSFARVDADPIEKLIKKEEPSISKLSEEQQDMLKKELETVITDKGYTIQLEAMDSTASPFIITEPEFMRRMKDMQATGGGGMFAMGNMPEMYNLFVNTNHELVEEILETKTAKKRERLIKQSLDLARLSKGLLKGGELTEFINRSYAMIK